MKRITMTALVALTLASGLGAQVMNSGDAPDPLPKAISPGTLNPSFWIGGKAVVIAGRNFETGAAGFSSTDTWGSFNFALVDSRYDIPKRLAVGEDPSLWSGYFALRNPTARINSWETTTELNWPAWQAGVQGQGFRFGVLSAGGAAQTGGNSGNVVAPGDLTVTGADRALVLGDRLSVDVDSPFLFNRESVVSVAYPVDGSVFGSWEAPQWAKVSLTVGSQNKGWVGAFSAEATPLGTASYDHPLGFKVLGNLVAGTGYPDTATGFQDGNPVGMGLAGQLDYVVDDDLVVSPLAAFDLRLNDTGPGITLADGSLKTEWKAAAGVMVSLSPKKWVGDDWGELRTQGPDFQNFEYSKIQKSSYFQVLADWGRAKVSEKQRDLNVLVRFEEPDGIVGFDENLGTLVEFSKTNLLSANPGSPSRWAAVGRVSYDLVAHKYSPFLRLYTDSTQIFKFRTGVQIAVLPGCAVEITYMSKNLNRGAAASFAAKDQPFDAGRLELMVGLSSDPAYNRTGKNMNFEYTGY